MKRRLVAALLVALLTAACDPGAVSPSPVLRAQLRTQGPFTISLCLMNGCTFQGEILNVGSGCAEDVRGVTRTFVNNEEFGRADWQVVFRVRPREVVLYTGLSLLVPDEPMEWTYDTELFWTDVACSAGA